MSIISGMLPAKRACKNQVYWTKEMNGDYVSNMFCFHSLPNRPQIRNCPYFSNFTDISFLSQDSWLTRENCKKHVDGYCTTLEACRNALIWRRHVFKRLFYILLPCWNCVISLCLTDVSRLVRLFWEDQTEDTSLQGTQSVAKSIFLFPPSKTATRYIMLWINLFCLFCMSFLNGKVITSRRVGKSQS